MELDEIKIKLSGFSAKEIGKRAKLSKNTVDAVRYGRNKDIKVLEKCLIAVQKLTEEKTAKINSIQKILHNA